MTRLALGSILCVALFWAGCGGGDGGTSSGTDVIGDIPMQEDAKECPQGTSQCPCFANGTCFGSLKCLANRCILVATDSGPDMPEDPDAMDAESTAGDVPETVVHDTLETADTGDCSTICDMHCGTYQGCNCGDCAGDLKCEANLCVPDCTQQDDPPDDKFIDSNCDGIDGNIAGAIFVAPVQHGGDDFNPGTMDLPKATIQAGIDAADGDPDKTMVLVSAGEYQGTVTLADGVGVFGGFHKPVGWERSDQYLVSVVVDQSDAQGDRFAVVAHGISLPTTLDFLQFEVKDNASPGGTSYGLHAMAAEELVVRRVDLVVGKGGNGPSGQQAGAAGSKKGAGGSSGGSACEDDSYSKCDSCNQPKAGINGAATICTYGGKGGAGGVGGLGGHQWLDWGTDGANGQGTGGVSDGGGEGGEGSFSQGSSSCTLGGNGAAGPTGTAGTDGPGGGSFGVFHSGLYQPAWGGETTNGTSGAGGGGGGGGLGTRQKHEELFNDWYCDVWGAGGGGGGAGGCGGGKGQSGNGGGGSFGLLFVDTYPEVTDVAVVVGPGGAGGAGTAGGLGSSGGSGGWGGYPNGSADCGKGGNGGAGGAGGRGGHGGGGGGGPSYCVFFHTPFTSPNLNWPNLTNVSCEGVMGGPGGGSPGNPGKEGASGNVDWCGEECWIED